MRKCLLAVFAALSTIALVSCDTPAATDFVKKGVKFSMYVVAVGKLASEKGQSEAVKQFAQESVQALGGIGDELKGLV